MPDGMSFAPDVTERHVAADRSRAISSRNGALAAPLAEAENIAGAPVAGSAHALVGASFMLAAMRSAAARR